MTTLEITLIIIGVVFLIGSFMVNDKLSHKDLDKIADMSAEELKIICCTPARSIALTNFSVPVTFIL